SRAAAEAQSRGCLRRHMCQTQHAPGVRRSTLAVPEMTALFTMDEAASELRISRRSLQDFLRVHPYYRTFGRRKLFSREDINRLIEALPCPGSSPPRAKAARPTGSSGANTLA